MECLVDKATNQTYKFKWKKVGSDKALSFNTTLRLKHLSQTNVGSYKCEIRRDVVGYETSKVVNISVKGIVDIFSIQFKTGFKQV